MLIADVIARAVVIPWRGFRCFTLGLPFTYVELAPGVVIPWRGFRCFTLEFDGQKVGGMEFREL